MAAELKLVRTAAEETLVARFPAAKASLPGDAAVLDLREVAFELLARRGLPHRRVEEWKYTDLRGLMREAAPLAANPTSADVAAALNGAKAFSAVEAVRVTLVNGHFAPELSDLERLPDGIEVIPFAAALASGHPLARQANPVESARDNAAYALNTAFMNDGAIIRVASGTVATSPIHLRFLNKATSAFATASRVLVIVEDRASVTLLESHEGPDGVAYQPNTVVDLIAHDNAAVKHVRLAADGRDALVLSTLAAKLGASTTFDTVNVVAGPGVTRHQVFLTFAGEHSRATVNGATMLNGKQHADTTLLVDHAVPHCDSRELFKTVIDDEATGVFQGKIIVHPQAQKTDGRMMSAALLLSEGGTMNNKPELEIFADDVQCGHGATCGALDEDLLFYLMARGLPRAEAESLMVQAFLGEAVEAVEHEATREALVAVIEGWLRARH
ncbi:MAG TPA: Fe-S cluster assembly protein SufD [Beijerinckiaceae bacterium]|nr:Fe-S cluster assembly protein SufD [Beijerinckiaceae bacterium]